MRKMINSKKENILSLGIVIGGGSGRILAQIFHDFINELIVRYAPETKVDWHFPHGQYTFPVENDKSPSFLPMNVPLSKVISSYKLIKDRSCVDTDESMLTQESYLQTEKIRAISHIEAKRLLKYYGDLKKKGVSTVFRTSINAEALYEARKNALAYKCIVLHKQDISQHLSVSDPVCGNEKRILLIRDQSQGYYANDAYRIVESGTEKERIEFLGHYSKEKFYKI